MAECFETENAILNESDSDTTFVKVPIDNRLDFQRPNIPELPYMKDYHLFVCYTEYNATEVRTIVEHLEREGLKCCYHERDFTAGHNILHNINNAIKRSMGIVIILSEEFVNHSFCQHEIQQALHTSITQGYIIIPLKIEPCSVPDLLMSMSYIDAQKTDMNEMHVLILNAFLQNVWQLEQNETNGLTLSFPLTKYKDGYKLLSMSRYKLLIKEEERHSLWTKGFHMTDDVIDEIQAIVSSSFYVKYKHVSKCFKRLTTLVFFMLSLFNAAFFFMYISATFSREADKPRWLKTNYIFVGSIIVIVMIWLVCILADVCGKCLNWKKWKEFTYNLEEQPKIQLNQTLWRKINRKATRVDKLLVIIDEDMLQIVRFDPRPCQDVFVRRCGHNMSLNKYKDPEETALEYAERMFDWYLKENCCMLTVPSKVYGRHQMINGATCLCSLLENAILQD